MDRLQSLKIFIAVAEAESFAEGARSIGLSAPSATRGIHALETELGTRLFTRTTRHVRLTDVGTAYLQDVREILASLQAADEAASGAAIAPAGRLRITCPQEFGRIYLAPIVAEFLQRHPSVHVDMLMIDRIVNIVEEGFDVALRIGSLPPSGLTALRVGQVRRVVCGAPGYFEARGRPESLSDLASHRAISLTPFSSDHRWRFGRDNEHTVRVQSPLSVNSVAAVIELARRGWGICRVLSYQVGPDLEAGTLDTVLEHEEPAPLPIHLVHVDGRRATAKVRTFMDFAAGRLSQIAVLR